MTLFQIKCDIHAHLWELNNPEHAEKRFLRELLEVSGRGGSLPDPSHFERDFREVEQVVVFGGRARHVGLHVPNSYVKEMVEKFQGSSRLIPFVSVDPHEKSFMDMFLEAVDDWGFKGVKLMPMYGNFDPRDQRLEPLYQKCEREGLPVLFHTGTTFCREAPLIYAQPLLLEAVALQFPELRIIAAHLGHPFVDQAVSLIRKQPNVYADLSALYYRPWQFFNYLMLIQEYGVTHKILFGTDYPFTKPLNTAEKWRAIAHASPPNEFACLSVDWIERLFKQDSMRLLGVSF